MGSFFKSLFDLKFETFITRKIAGIFYAINLGLIGLLALALISAAGDAFGAVGAIAALIVVPIITFIAIILTRLVFESSVALVTVAENTKK
jgi:uncharacterized membrane protein YuzA (DUF378 family)